MEAIDVKFKLKRWFQSISLPKSAGGISLWVSLHNFVRVLCLRLTRRTSGCRKQLPAFPCLSRWVDTPKRGIDTSLSDREAAVRPLTGL